MTVTAEHFIYDEVALALFDGSVNRPPLPRELVCFICRLSEFYLTAEAFHAQSSIRVYARSAKLENTLWLETRPLSRSDIYNTATITVQTESKHQGWALPNHGSWRYFSLAILSPGGTGNIGMERVRLREDSEPMMWTSTQWNRGIGLLGHERSMLGTRYGRFWEDSIGLVTCAQFPGWSCEGREAEITLNAFYEPLV